MPRLQRVLSNLVTVQVDHGYIVSKKFGKPEMIVGISITPPWVGIGRWCGYQPHIALAI